MIRNVDAPKDRNVYLSQLAKAKLDMDTKIITSFAPFIVRSASDLYLPSSIEGIVTLYALKIDGVSCITDR